MNFIYIQAGALTAVDSDEIDSVRALQFASGSFSAGSLLPIFPYQFYSGNRFSKEDEQSLYLSNTFVLPLKANKL